MVLLSAFRVTADIHESTIRTGFLLGYTIGALDLPNLGKSSYVAGHETLTGPPSRGGQSNGIALLCRYHRCESDMGDI